MKTLLFLSIFILSVILSSCTGGAYVSSGTGFGSYGYGNVSGYGGPYRPNVYGGYGVYNSGFNRGTYHGGYYRR